MRTAQGRVGFTLIELLIVVAIIGILAAIAIPNFLEAQIRAKVARASSDLRTISLGLEQYNLDWNVYPADWYYYANCAGAPASLWWNIKHQLKGLTTPVEYITTVPSTDPFGKPTATTANGMYMYVNDAEQRYWQHQCAGGQPAARYNWVYKTAQYGPGWPGFYWLLKSAGPDRSIEWGTNEHLYDPTNGTVSMGEIPRTGP